MSVLRPLNALDETALPEDTVAVSRASQASYVRRSTRRSGVSDIASRSVQHLLRLLESNDPSIRILRLKNFLRADMSFASVELVFDALLRNTSVEVLYCQALTDKAMPDAQMDTLLKILKRGTIWGLNAGELYNITNAKWEEFTRALSDTNVTHLYTSEHTITPQLKDEMRAAARKNRRTDARHLCMHRRALILKVRNMWWNPTLPLLPMLPPDCAACVACRSVVGADALVFCSRAGCGNLFHRHCVSRTASPPNPLVAMPGRTHAPRDGSPAEPSNVLPPPPTCFHCRVDRGCGSGRRSRSPTSDPRTPGGHGSHDDLARTNELLTRVYRQDPFWCRVYLGAGNSIKAGDSAKSGSTVSQRTEQAAPAVVAGGSAATPIGSASEPGTPPVVAKRQGKSSSKGSGRKRNHSRGAPAAAKPGQDLPPATVIEGETYFLGRVHHRINLKHVHVVVAENDGTFNRSPSGTTRLNFDQARYWLGADVVWVRIFLPINTSSHVIVGGSTEDERTPLSDKGREVWWPGQLVFPSNAIESGLHTTANASNKQMLVVTSPAGTSHEVTLCGRGDSPHALGNTPNTCSASMSTKKQRRHSGTKKGRSSASLETPDKPAQSPRKRKGSNNARKTPARTAKKATPKRARPSSAAKRARAALNSKASLPPPDLSKMTERQQIRYLLAQTAGTPTPNDSPVANKAKTPRARAVERAPLPTEKSVCTTDHTRTTEKLEPKRDRKSTPVLDTVHSSKLSSRASDALEGAQVTEQTAKSAQPKPRANDENTRSDANLSVENTPTSKAKVRVLQRTTPSAGSDAAHSGTSRQTPQMSPAKTPTGQRAEGSLPLASGRKVERAAVVLFGCPQGFGPVAGNLPRQGVHDDQFPQHVSFVPVELDNSSANIVPFLSVGDPSRASFDGAARSEPWYAALVGRVQAAMDTIGYREATADGVVARWLATPLPSLRPRSEDRRNTVAPPAWQGLEQALKEALYESRASHYRVHHDVTQRRPDEML